MSRDKHPHTPLMAIYDQALKMYKSFGQAVILKIHLKEINMAVHEGLAIPTFRPVLFIITYF